MERERERESLGVRCERGKMGVGKREMREPEIL